MVKDKYKYAGEERQHLLAQERERLEKIPRLQCSVCLKDGAIWSGFVNRKDNTGKIYKHGLFEHPDEQPMPSVFDYRGHEHFRYRRCITNALLEGSPIAFLNMTSKEKQEQRTALATMSGIEMAYVYHCNRCNYSWLPRDYDPAYQDIMKMQPPKGCARCKSPCWRSSPQRHTKNFAYPNSSARARALLRSGKIKSKASSKT